MPNKLHELGAEYLELKEVRDHYDGLMKEISYAIECSMVLDGLAGYKEGVVSISMSNTSRVSVKGFKQALMEAGVDVITISECEEIAKPKPKYSPRIMKLKNELQPTVIMRYPIATSTKG